DSTSPDGEHAEFPEPPRDPIEREGIGNHREIERQHAGSGNWRHRTKDGIATAQQNGKCREGGASLQDEGDEVSDECTVAGKQSCPNQLQSLVRALHHAGGHGLAEGYDSKDLHPKMARYVGEQSKCCHPSKNFAGSQSREGGQDISDLHRWMQCQTTACYGSP